MEDKRFSELFSDPNFQINPDSEEFRLLNPVVQKANEKKLKKPTRVIEDVRLYLELYQARISIFGILLSF